MSRPLFARPVYFMSVPARSAMLVYQVPEPILTAQHVWDTGTPNKEAQLVYDVGAPAKNAVPVYLVNAWYRSADLPAPLLAYQPKGAGSSALALVNKASPGTYDATGAVGWTRAAGWRLTVGQNIATGYTVAGNLKPYTLAVRINNAETTGAWYAAITGAQLSIRPNFVDGDSQVVGANRVIGNLVGTVLNGVLVLTHAVGDDNPKLYMNGTLLAPTFGGVLGGANAALVLMQRSTAAANPTMQAAALYTTALSAPQVATLTAALQAL